MADTVAYAPEDYEIAYVKIVDGAKNGCWTNIGEVQTYAEDQLKLAGFNVVDELKVSDEELSPILAANGIAYFINVVGERLNNGLCVGYVDSRFLASLENPNRNGFSFVNPIGLSAQPYSVWNGKNFNTYVLDYVKVAIPTWVERGVFSDLE